MEWFCLTSGEVVQLPRATGAALAAEPTDDNDGANGYGLSAVRFIVK